MKKTFLILCLLLLFACDDKYDKYPGQVYTSREHLLTRQEIETYWPYIQAIDNMGDFRIEFITDSSDNWNTIFIGCHQFYNDLLIDYPVTFIFPTNPAGQVKEARSHVTDMFPGGIELPTIPEISFSEAIRSASGKEPFETFCNYELCYYRTGPADAVLCWKLYGRTQHVHVSAETGALISNDLQKPL